MSSPMHSASTAQPVNIVIAGVGGQGTVLASKLIAAAALLEGSDVRTAETIGMAQRGGTVLGHVRLAPAGHASVPLSPLVPNGKANLLIGFEPGETVRALGYLQQGGAVVTAKQVIEPVTATLSGRVYDGVEELAYLESLTQTGRIGSLVAIDGNLACRSIGSKRVLNVILLGAALASGQLGIERTSLISAIEALVKTDFVEVNTRALARGIELANREERGAHSGQGQVEQEEQGTWL